MENSDGKLVDLYVPRKCAATNRLIKAHDHASVQINVADVDESGRMLNTQTSFALCGFVREKDNQLHTTALTSTGEGDDCINKLATQAGLLKNVWSYSR